MFYIYLGTKNPKNSHPNLFFYRKLWSFLNCQSKFRALYHKGWSNFMPLYSTSISDRKRRKPHFYDSRLFIYIFRFFSLASGWFWIFSYFFCALCPFSTTQLRIFLWFPDDFGLFYAFSVLYVHFLLPGSVFPSGFRRILDFFTLFLCFMSIFSCPAPYFPLASEWFWTFLLFFCALCPFSPIQLRISL